MAQTLAEKIAAKKLLASNPQEPLPSADPAIAVVEQAKQQEIVNAIEDLPAALEPAPAQGKQNLSTEQMLDLDLESLGKMNANILLEANLTLNEIVPRIRSLSDVPDANIKNEMELLKKALMANPEAVALMLPTDVGLLVQSLRRITQEAIVNAEKTKKAPKEKAAKIDFSAQVDDF